MANRSIQEPDEDCSSAGIPGMINRGSVMLVFVAGHAGSMLSILLIARTMSPDDFDNLSSSRLEIQNFMVLLGFVGL